MKNWVVKTEAAKDGWSTYIWILAFIIQNKFGLLIENNKLLDGSNCKLCKSLLAIDR